MFRRDTVGGRFKLVALEALLLATTIGCGSNALITRRWGAPPVEATIVGGSKRTVFLKDSYGPAALPREDISDVDHPGTGEMAGGITAVLGVLLTGISGAALLPVGLGLPLFCYGVVIYQESVDAFNDTSRRDPPEPVRRKKQPPVDVDIDEEQEGKTEDKTESKAAKTAVTGQPEPAKSSGDKPAGTP